jgi:hypothetical protein
MRYELRLLLLSVCLVFIWPGQATIYLFFAALGWLFLSCGYGVITGMELFKLPVKDNWLDDR